MSVLLQRPEADEKQEGRVPFYVDVPAHRTVINEVKAYKGLDLKLGSPAKGDLLLDGYASTWVLDRDQEYVSRRAFDSTLGSYLKDNPILLWQHMRDKVLGQILEGGTDDTGLAVQGWVRKPADGEEPWKVSAFNDIKAGIVRTMSIGGFMEREIVESEILIVKIDLFETSVVSIPSNPLSIFEAGVKAVKGLPMSGNADAVVEQMTQLLGMYPMVDPQLASLDKEAQLERYTELSVMFVQAKGVQPPGFNDYREVESNFDSNPGEALTELHGMLGVLASGDKTTSAEAKDLHSFDTKKGRVLSAKNEQRLEAARGQVQKAGDTIDGVLAQVRRDAESDGEGQAAADEGDDKGTKPPNLRSGSPTKSCSNCTHFKSTSGGSDNMGFCKKYKYTVKKGQLCDSYSAKSADGGGEKQLTSDVRQQLDSQGTERWGDDDTYVYVDDFDMDENQAVFCISSPDGRDYMQVDFTRADDGAVELGSDETEVRRTTDYTPV